MKWKGDIKYIYYEKVPCLLYFTSVERDVAFCFISCHFWNIKSVISTKKTEIKLLEKMPKTKKVNHGQEF